MATLDSRETRPLTSREICKVISGALCGAVQAGADPDAALEHLRSLQDVLFGRPFADHGHLSAIPSPDPEWCGAIGGLIGAMMGWCRARDMEVATDWICEHWGDLMATAARARLIAEIRNTGSIQRPASGARHRTGGAR